MTRPLDDTRRDDRHPAGKAPRVADVVARTLHAFGIRTAFGMPGGEVVTLLDALGAAGIAFVLTRHETAAAIMAAGARALDRRAGPPRDDPRAGPCQRGQRHRRRRAGARAADRDLRRRRAASRARYTHQILDHAALLRAVVKGSFEIEAEGAAATVARGDPPRHDAAVRPGASRPFARRRGGAPTARAAVAAPGDRRRAPPSTMRRMARRRRRSRRGEASARPRRLRGGARRAPATALTAFADAGVPVLTTYKAKGVIDERHPSPSAPPGCHRRPTRCCATLVARADLVLLAGYDPIEMRPAGSIPSAQATVVEIGAASADHGMHRVDRRVLAAPGALLAAIVPRPAARRLLAGRRAGALRAALERGLPRAAAARARRRLRGLGGDLPAEAIVTVDSGAHRILFASSGAPAGRWRCCNPPACAPWARRCPWPSARRAAARAPVVAVMGDGGLEMGLGELGTLRDPGLPVIAVVLQDESLALIEMKQRQAGLAEAGVRLGRTDLAALAESFGGAGITVRDAQALREAIAAALARRDRFTLIACITGADAYDGRI